MKGVYRSVNGKQVLAVTYIIPVYPGFPIFMWQVYNILVIGRSMGRQVLAVTYNYIIPIHPIGNTIKKQKPCT